MKRVLLDTNIYGLLVADYRLLEIKEKYHSQREVIIYGITLLRKELRATHPSKLIKGKNLRIALLNLYDELTGSHILEMKVAEIQALSSKYYEVYRQLGGHLSKEALLADFEVIACAALANLDVVVSNDNSTMPSGDATKAYSIAHSLLSLRTPEFVNYDVFLSTLTRGLV